MILQRYYNLSDEQVEYQIKDRMSFMRFLDLSIADDVPDSRTVWKFREQLTDLKLIETIFNMFLKKLETINLVVNEWKIVDASFIEVPRQRNNRDENKKLKNNEIPEEWKNKPRKLSQKDTDARWTNNNNQNFFGFINHVKIDSKSKIITKFMVTIANVHDSQAPDNLFDSKDKEQ